MPPAGLEGAREIEHQPNEAEKKGRPKAAWENGIRLAIKEEARRELCGIRRPFAAPAACRSEGAERAHRRRGTER